MNKDMATMPIPELTAAIREKAGESNDIALSLVLTVLANRLDGAYNEGIKVAIDALKYGGSRQETLKILRGKLT